MSVGFSAEKNSMLDNNILLFLEKIMLFLEEQEKRFRDLAVNTSREQVKLICERGNVESIIWLGDHGYWFTCWDMDAAAQYGQIDIVKVMLEKYGCRKSGWIASALQAKQLEVVSYLIKNDETWNCSNEWMVMIIACQSKVSGIFKWLRYNIIGPLNPFLMTIAAANDNLEVIKDMRKEGYPFMREIRSYATTDVLVWLKDHECPRINS